MQNDLNRIGPTTLALAMLLVLSHVPSPARAQDIKFGSAEIGGFGGMNNFSQSLGTKTTFGGSAGFRLTDRALVVGEFSHVKPLAESSGGERVELNSYLLDMGVHVQFPIAPKVAPYIAGGGGIMHSRLSSTVQLFNGENEMNGNDLQANFGGGVRLYVTPNLVFRPEFKFYKIPDLHFVRFTGGIYYQFGK